ncbi:hypothetical protein IT415_02865 [bacterium]|nr:hypothetical protein [bacterium]
MQYLASKIRGSWLVDSHSSDMPLIGLIERIILDPGSLQVVLFGLGTGDKQPVRHYIRADQVIVDKTNGLISASFESAGKAEDFIREQDTLRTHCELLHYKVVDGANKYVGRVHDYSLTVPLLRIEKLHITTPIWRRLKDTHRIITRSQVIDVDCTKKLIRIKNSTATQRSRASQAIPA